MNTIQQDPQMQYALSQIRHMKTEGERRKWLDSYFGFDDRGECKCVDCRDTGWVIVYHPKCFVQLSKSIPIKWHQQCAVRCKCSAANTIVSKDRRGRRIPSFGDRNWHIRVNHPDSRAKLMNFDLMSICDAKRYDEFEAFS